MTTACAWCDSVQSVDLAQLAKSGLSHGICVACMPRAFGRGALMAYLAHAKKATCLICVNGLKLEPEAGTSQHASWNHISGGLNA